EVINREGAFHPVWEPANFANQSVMSMISHNTTNQLSRCTMNFRKLVDAIILLLLLAPSAMYAQEKDQFPIPFGPNNFGNEFYFAMPVNWGAPQMDVHYVRLYMVSPVRTTVSVWAGGQLKETFETIPNEIRTVDLTPEEAQMFVRDADLSVPDDSI